MCLQRTILISGLTEKVLLSQSAGRAAAVAGLEAPPQESPKDISTESHWKWCYSQSKPIHVPCITAASEYFSEGHLFLLSDVLSLSFLTCLRKRVKHLVWPKLVCQHLHWVQNEAHCDRISLPASENFSMTPLRSFRIDLMSSQTIFLSNLTNLESSKNVDFLWSSISTLTAH